VLPQPDRRKWTHWIDRISAELARSSVDREVFKQWSDIVERNPNLDMNNRFMSLIWSCYFDRQVLVVRRQVHCKKQSISLVRLLHEVAGYSGRLTRQDFVTSYTRPRFRDTWREGHRLFDTFAGRGREYVSRDRVLADAARLVWLSRGLKYISDKWLAHSDPRRRWPRLGFRQLNRALDALYDAWKRYHVLVRRGPIDADPKRLAGSDWQHVFDIPWRAKDEGSPAGGQKLNPAGRGELPDTVPVRHS
jgi:hypothetical protein